MFPNNPNPDRSLIAFPGFPIPSKAVQAFPGFPILGTPAAAIPQDLFNYLDGWNQEQIYEITVDNTLIDSELANFPVLIKMETNWSTYVAKSIILDMADCYGNTSYMGLRSVEFKLHGKVVQVLTSEITCYATSEYSTSYSPDNAFDITYLKTGSQADTQWLAITGSYTNQRVICVFDNPITFDEIVINNAHHTGAITDAGIKNTKIQISDSAITDTTYDGAISDGVVLFEGVLVEHFATDSKDDETISLTALSYAIKKIKQYTATVCLESFAEGEENPTYMGSAFDGVLTDSSAAGSWYAYDGGYVNIGWTGQDFGVDNSKCIEQYSFYVDNSVNAPKTWTFEGSDTGAWAGEETVLDTQTDYAFDSIMKWRYFPINNSTSYRYYRVNVTVNNGDATYLIIREIEMCEKIITLDNEIFNEVLLLHSDTYDGSSIFTDSSPSACVIEPPLTCTHIDDSAKFGNSCISFDNTVGGLEITGTHDELVFEGDFTIDQWLYPIAGSGSMSLVNYSTVNRLHVLFTDSNTSGRVLIGGANFITGIVLLANTWQHYALVRKDGEVKAYINGVQSGTTGSTTGVIGGTTSNWIGTSPGAHHGDGYIDELRILKGVAKWTDTFTVPDSQYRVDEVYTDLFAELHHNLRDNTGEVLLIHSDSTDGSVEFEDSSISGHSIIVGGDSHHETDLKKFGDTAIYFDGTGDYISVADSTDFTFGSDDFTIDFWMARGRIGTREFPLGTVDSSGTAGTISIRMEITVANGINIYRNSTDHITGYVFDTANVFKHFAIMRNGVYLQMYVDGILEWELDIGTTALVDSANNFSIGRQGEYAGLTFQGYIDEFKITKGVAKWTDNFVPPTAPYSDAIILTDDEIVNQLAVADINGNQLYAEVQDWDSNTEIALLWAKIPVVKADQDTKLYVYYDYDYAPVNYVTAKSVIFDFSADNWGGGADPYDYFGIRSIELKYKGELVTYDIGDVTIYATSEFSATYAKEYAFDQTLSKTGAWGSNQWLSEVDGGGAGIAGDQRLIIVFSGTEKFDEIVVNNSHSSGGTTEYAVKGTKIYYSTDTITDTTYGAAIANSELIFDGVCVQHIATDIEHSQVVYKYNPTDEQTGATLLIHSDTVDTDPVSHDTSFNGHALTPTSVTHEDDYAKFGNTSMYFGVAASEFDVINDGSFDFGTDAFTIDFWIWKSSFAGNSYMFDIGTNGSRFTMNAGTCFIYSGGTMIFTESSVPPVSQWNHIALTNDGAGTYYLFFNGVLIDSTANAVAFGHATALLTVGNYGGGTGYSILGYLEEFRIVKGTCAWTDNFSPPPAPYAQLNEYFTGIVGSISAMNAWNDNFKAVYHMNQDPSGGTDCILDSTQNINHGTPAGTMLTEDLVDGVVGKAIEFDGSDDYIDLGSLLGIDSSESFSINMLLNLTSFTNSYGIAISVKTDTSENFRIIFSDQTSYLDIAFGSNSATFANGDTGNISFAVETTQLLTLTYNGNGASTLSNYKLYLDGEEKTLTASGAFGTDTTNALIGGSVATTFWEGLMDEVFVSWTTDSDAWIKANYNSLINNLLTIAKKV